MTLKINPTTDIKKRASIDEDASDSTSLKGEGFPVSFTLTSIRSLFSSNEAKKKSRKTPVRTKKKKKPVSTNK